MNWYMSDSLIKVNDGRIAMYEVNLADGGMEDVKKVFLVTERSMI